MPKEGTEYETGITGGGSSGGGGSNPTGLEGLTTAEVANLPTGVTEIAYDDITNDNLKDPDKIKAVITGEVPIPKDATYEEGTVDTGVVIKYKNSEFVWVPVPVTAGNNLWVKGTTKPMARVTSGKDANNRDNYQGVLYTYSGTGDSTTSAEMTSSYGQGTTSYREPDVLTNTSYGDWSTKSSGGYNLIKQYIDGMSEKTNEEIQTLWTKQLQEEYNEMIESVSKYGGFFIGRYETSISGTTVASVADVSPMSAETSSGGTWYGMYQKQKNFATGNMISSMIWGSQYDAMLNWALTGGDKSHVIASSYGNHSGSVKNTKATTTDKINNIYDLEGNLYEWLQEARDVYSRTTRGGNYSTGLSPGGRGYGYPLRTYASLGSRLSLYIKWR